MANIEDLRDRSVSSGTLKSEDLIPKFLGVLKTYGKDKYDAYIKENPEVEDWENLDEETMGWVVDELTDLLSEIAPDGCYFGASDGDGADFGFWSMSNESKKSERAIPVSGAIKQKINDGITQCLLAIKGAGAVANPIKVTNSTDKPELSTRDTLVYAPSYVYRESGMERNFVGVMFHVEKDGQYGQLFIGWDKKNNRPFVWAGGATFDSYDSFCNDFKRDFSECFKTISAKKSESLTLKQKELKDMARFGQAEDITTISDEEAKALRKKGIETIGVSRGTYGMNGALLRDNEGKKYVITARSSNLFYFV